MGAVGVGRHRKPPASGLGSEGTFSPPFSLIVSPGIAARDVAGGLRSLAQAARGVAALTSDPAVQAIVLDTASDVLDKASSLIEEAKKAAGHPGTLRASSGLPRFGFGPRLLPPSPPTPSEGCLEGVSHQHCGSSLDSTLLLHLSRRVSAKARPGPSQAPHLGKFDTLT